MRSAGFWLSDRAWAAIGPLLPQNWPGARRADDRRVISGTIHVLRVGGRWQDCPPGDGPSTTICNRFNRWRHRGLRARHFAASWRRRNCPMISASTAPPCARTGPHTAETGAKVQAIRCPAGECAQSPRGGRSRGGPTTKTHALTEACRRAVAFRLSPGNRAGISAAAALPDKWPPPTRLLVDKGYDANRLRARLKNSETIAVIPATRSRKVPIPHDALADTRRNLIECAIWLARTAPWPKRQRFWCSERSWRRFGDRTRTHDQHPTSPNCRLADRRGRHRWRAPRQSLR